MERNRNLTIRKSDKSRWTAYDEIKFLRSLVMPYRQQGRGFEDGLLPSLCEDYGLDPLRVLTGYLKSLPLRKNWGPYISPGEVWKFKEEALNQLSLWKGNHVDTDKEGR